MPPMPAAITLALRCALLAAALAAPALHGQALAAAPSTAVAWQPAANDADIDRAFGRARAEGKPVLLYWGAKWCPPCNQLKATLFNRQDFIERSKAFVAVNIDGDLPGAQKLGARFKVRGYPTMILMRADGTELTRLPGEADAPQVLALLQQGLNGGRPAKALLADARASKPLTAAEWRALALYAWDLDEDQLLPAAERPGVLIQLSAACGATDAEAATRLMLKALGASDEGKGVKPDAALRQRVLTLLADPVATRTQMETVVGGARAIARTLTPEPGADREALVRAYDTALRRLEADATLSRADRLGALIGRVALARLEVPKAEVHPKLDKALLEAVREHATRQDREITDGYERQAVVTEAAYLLGLAGLWADSDALLQANLARSHSPYYLMSQLGGNARKLGRTDEALRWYQQAFDKSEGPATRLQWGAGYVAALVELAPKDGARIEKAAGQLFKEAGQDQGAFYERSARSLQRVGNKLADWNADGRQGAALQRLHRQLSGVCGRIPKADAQRATCDDIAAKLAPRKA